DGRTAHHYRPVPLGREKGPTAPYAWRPRLGDPHPRDLDRLATDDHVLGVTLARPARTSATSCGTVKPCASMIASVAPSGELASSSSARRRSGWGSWRRRRGWDMEWAGGG